MNVFKLLQTLQAKISQLLPNILGDVTSIQDSDSGCKYKIFRNSLINQLYLNNIMKNCGVCL
jgi:hypothetical protein